MRDEVYVGNLVSSNELRHSAKGSHWKEHKYLKVVNGIYTYPKRKKEKYLARKEAAENIDEYSRLANEYNAEADKFESEAEELEKQSRDANREQIRNDRLIRETVNKPVPLHGYTGNKEYTIMLPGSQKEDAIEEVYYKSHRGYKDGDTEIKNTLTAGPATHAAQKKRLAQGKRYRAKTSRNKANEYGQKKAQALMTLHDRDIVDKGIDAVTGLFSRKKKKKIEHSEEVIDLHDLNSNELYHHGILGMRWGVRRYQNKDGSLTDAGKKRYHDANAKTEKTSEINDAKTIMSDMDDFFKKYRERPDHDVSKEREEIFDKIENNWLSTSSGSREMYERMRTDPEFKKRVISACDLGLKGLDEMNGPGYVDWDAYKERPGNQREWFAIEDQTIGMLPIADLINRGYTGEQVGKLIDFIDEEGRETRNKKDVSGYGYVCYFDVREGWADELKPFARACERAKNKDVKHSDLLDDYLEHWGILGMKWGVRRYQNKDGSLTSAGRKRYASGKSVGFFEARRLKKKRVEAAKKRQATLEAKKKAEEDAQKHEAEKQEAIRSGNATQIAKFQNELSNQELRDVLARLDSKQKLSELVAKETPKKETKLDKAMKIAEKGAKYAEVAEKGIKVYNTFAKVSNAFADDNNQLPIIGEKREKKAPKNEAKEAAIRSGDAKEIAKWKGKLTPEETKTAMLTLDYWDKIKEKSVSSTVKEQREGQKAAAKELAEKLSTHSDEYNEAVKRARDLDLHIKEQNRAERKQRVDEAKTALKELVNPSDRTKTIREYSNAEIGSKEVIDRILKDLEKNRR